MSQLESSADVDALIKRLEDQSVTKFVTFSVDRHYNEKGLILQDGTEVEIQAGMIFTRRFIFKSVQRAHEEMSFYEVIRLRQGQTTRSLLAYSDWQPSPLNRVHWQWAGGSGMPAIEFTGVPFMFVGSKRLVCHQGKDLAVSQKRKYFEEKARKMSEEQSLGNQKSRRPTTKKVGCPAAISISKIATFPEFKVDDNTERSKKTASKTLRVALERDPVVWETRYAVTHSSEHAGHANRRYETDVTSGSGLLSRKRARKAALRKRCMKLTKQLMDSLRDIEDQHTLEELSKVLGTLLQDLVPLSSTVDRKPFRLKAKTPGVSSPVSQMRPGGPKHKQQAGALLLNFNSL